MSRWRQLGVATLAIAMVVPVAAVIAGSENATGGDVARQSAAWTGKQEARKAWKEVPGVSLGQTNVVNTPDVQSITVSAQMTKGAVKFRIVPALGGPAVVPGSARFDAKASNAFSWAIEDTCGQGEAHQLQWKKVGKGKAIAAKIATHTVWDGLCL